MVLETMITEIGPETPIKILRWPKYYPYKNITKKEPAGNQELRQQQPQGKLAYEVKLHTTTSQIQKLHKIQS